MRIKLTSLFFVLAALVSAPVFGQAPFVISIDPPPSNVVQQVTYVNIIFSENVTGVDATDLLVNSASPTNVVQNSPRDYTFQFASIQTTGTVTVAWVANPGIVDFDAVPGNEFVPDPPWTFTLDPNAIPQMALISEFMADNASFNEDEDGSRSDWLEIYNPGSASVSLEGWALTDTPTNLTKWRFPNVILAANRYLLIWASEKNRTNPAAPLHTNFRLSRNASSYLALVNPDRMIVSLFSGLNYPAQQANVSFGRAVASPENLGYFVAPTPGAQNAMSGVGFAPEPVVSHESGVYTNDSFSFVITVPPDTIVRYTTNGSVPTNGSPAYTGPITVQGNSSYRIRAFPTAANLFPGPVVARNFLFLDATTREFNSNLPVLVLSSEGRNIGQNQISGARRTVGTFVAFDTFRGRSSFSRKPDYIGPAAFEVVGQTSAGFAKKPYRIEFQDELENDKDVPLLGLPAEADWQLRNPFSDKCLMNDFLSYELWEQMGHYSCRRKLVEVFVDSGGGRLTYPNDYIGVEVLFERIERGKDRVDIAELTAAHTNEPAITGGFIFKKDKASDGDLNIIAGGQSLKLHEPKPQAMRKVPLRNVGETTYSPTLASVTNYTPSATNQLNYLIRYLNAFSASMTGPGWPLRTGTNHYSHYIDVDSFVDQHWMVEFTKQIDGYRLSGYYNKDRNGKVKPEPIWDWNLSFGNADYLQGGQTNTWYYTQASADDHIWLRALVGAQSLPNSGGDPDFIQKVIDRWGVLRTNIMSGDRVLSRIDQIANILKDGGAARSPVSRNFGDKYTNRTDAVTESGALNRYIWPNPDGPPDHINYVQPTYDLIISEMKKWTMGHFQWIDSLLPKAPTLDVPEGDVPGSTSVTISAPAGTIYYTLDGTDPRRSQAGGAVAPGAITYAGSVVVNDNARIFARARVGTNWSPPAVATYVVQRPRLVITEIMYHPQPPLIGSTNTESDYEYVEFRNVGTAALNLEGYTLGGGVQFTFPNRSLPAGERVLVVHNQAAFLSRYPGLAGSIAGEFTNSLANQGERLVLQGRLREPILDFRYDDTWYPITDGFGFALVIVDDTAPVNTWGLASSWRPGGTLNGTPGQAETATPSIPRVVISEARTHSDPPGPTNDVVELQNLSGGPASIGGWYLTDDFRRPKKYRIPAGTPAVPDSGFVTFDQTQFGVGPNGFALSSTGDELYLFSANAAGDLTGYQHGFSFGAQFNGVTFGRHILSTTADAFVAQTSPTLGAPNAGPANGPVVISEVNYHPVDIVNQYGTFDDNENEFVELHNLTASAVSLYDPAHPTNTWRLRDAVDFDFPPGASLPANAYALVVGFDPADAAMLAAFRSRNLVPAGVQIFGPYSGKLDNSDDDIELRRPDGPNPDGSVPYVLADRVHYSAKAPWPVGADGIGPTLQRLTESAYGNDPINWTAGGRTPGASYVAGPSPVITRQPQSQTNIAYREVQLSVGATGPGPLSYQWRFRGTPISGATADTLVIPVAVPANEGDYDVIVINPAGVAASATARLTLRIPMQFTQQPQSQAARPGTNITFTAGVISTAPPVRYQWFVNGTVIPDATNSSYTVNNVGIQNRGTYFVRASDGVVPTNSSSATLTVLIDPLIVGQPLPLNVAPAGGNVTLSVVITNTATLPITYRWRRAGTTAASNTINSYVSTVTVTNVQGSAIWTVVAQNQSRPSGVISSNAVVEATADTDGDGIPDDWETANGYNPNNPADATADTDGDGVRNRDEYIAGTDPRDNRSYLRVNRITATGGATLEFLAAANRTYSVLFTDDVRSGMWRKLTDVAAQEASRVETITDSSAPGVRFYRLATPAVNQ